MWMMGYNEAAAAADFNMNLESYTNNNGGRKLRPLVPRPPPLSHHLGEQNKREFNSQQMVVVSSRWNPTPEQLQTLEELYRRGTRTPSADEIQHITAQLRRFGKIEGKNVFYWFQNHKARERQKRRRQLDNTTNDHHQPPFLSNDINKINLDQSIERKDSEVNRTCYEVEETRNWGIPTFSQKIALKERTPKATIMAESTTTTTIDQGWIPIEQGEGNDQLLLLQRRRKSLPERNATWHQMMQCLSSTPLANPVIINSPTCTPSTVSTFTPSIMSSNGVSPYIDCHIPHDVQSCQTLQLFPVNNGREQPEKCFLPMSDVSLGPRQFIEFLPLKN